MNPGTRLGPYEIVSRIGAGGMGEVFKALDTRLDRSVAIKILPDEFSRDAQLRLRFEREAKTISQLNHPHICTLYDVGHENGNIYLVMEYIEGDTLADRLSRGALPFAQALRYGAQIADALSKAHASGIVHRDLKPANVMITKSGAKLLDFGLAKAATSPASAESHAATTLAHEQSLTQEGTIVGTIQYMAPEQLESRGIDSRTDIFALGVLLYEMVTGRRAFEGSSQAGVIAAIIKSEPVPLKSLMPAAPPALDRLIGKCLEKDPGRRWQSTSDLADELRWMLEDLSAGERTAPEIRRTAVRWAWVIPIAIMATVAFAMWRGSRGSLVSAGPPRIVLMDSTNPERIYSSVTRANGGTNADDLTNLLRDLPVTLVKENTSALWNREDQIVNERPDLVIMHRSSFASSRTIIPDQQLFDYAFSLGERKVQAFIGYVGLANPRTRFIVYSRSWMNAGGGPLWVSELQGRFPHLRGRVQTIDVTGHPEPSFRDPTSAAKMRNDVIRTLGLKAR